MKETFRVFSPQTVQKVAQMVCGRRQIWAILNKIDFFMTRTSHYAIGSLIHKGNRKIAGSSQGQMGQMVHIFALISHLMSKRDILN